MEHTMNFFRKIFPRSIKKNMVSDTMENSNITKEPAIHQSYSQVNISNKLETKSYVTDNKDENDSSVARVDEFSFTKILHNLANVAPIEISTNDYKNTKPELNEGSLNDIVSEDARILNIAAGENSVINGRENGPDINQNDNGLKQTQVSYEVTVSNADMINVIDDETMQNLKEFEEALNNIDKTAHSKDVGSELIDLDEIFDELDAGHDDLISIKSFSVLLNNESATLKEKDITDANNEIHSNINDNIDVISINSSTEDEKSETIELNDTISINIISDESDSGDSYKSSDFEFISETEAKMTGIMINFKVEKCQNLSQNSPEPVIHYFNAEKRDQGGENDTSSSGEGPSRENKPRNIFEDRSYRNDHQIPVGDNFLGLFQGIYNPLLPMSEIYFLENKSVRTSAMNSQYDGIGFDKQLALRRHQPDSSEDEFEEEARESAKKILGMYPGENRKRRRRYL